MLTESFVCSTTAVSQPASKAAAHGIFEHTLSPVPSVRSSFKHSSALPNCLSLTSTHVFAAQDQKAVVHVYNRERGSLEARVPFNDKISSLALIGVNEYEGQLGTLVLGMGAGRLLLWEVSALSVTSRQIH